MKPKVSRRNDVKITELNEAEDKKKIFYLLNSTDLYEYDTDKKEATFISSEVYSYVPSPNGEAIGINTIVSGINTARVYKDGKTYDVGEGFGVYCLSDDGEVVYGIENEFKIIYSAGINAKPKKLAEGASFECKSGDSRQVIISVGNDIYLSADREYPFFIYHGAKEVTCRTKAEKGFKGNLFCVRVANKNYLCILNSNYEFEVISDEIYDTRLLDDGKTLLFTKDFVIYKAKEGSSKVKKIGVGPIFGISPSGFGFYSFFSGGAVYNSFDGTTTNVMSGEYVNDCIVFLERDPPKSLPKKAEETELETNSDGSIVINTPKEDNEFTYSLYCVNRGGEKKLIMNDIASYRVVGDTLYVFRLNENAVFGESSRYDVYGGTSINNIKLLIEGVCIK